jgi:hypothetical protein
LVKIWDQPDEGIWEVRGPPQHFTHSKVMVWVAFDRMVKQYRPHASAVATSTRHDPRGYLRQGVRS